MPVSMAPLQKEIYRSILSMFSPVMKVTKSADLPTGQNLDILRSLAEGNSSSTKGNSSISKTNMNNMLMQLRKYAGSPFTDYRLDLTHLPRCIQHPYLVSEDIEPKGLSPQETHERLVGASAKLRLLKTLLPKLRARGHRVLLFSQVSGPTKLACLRLCWSIDIRDATSLTFMPC